jgi:hypothetical protein
MHKARVSSSFVCAGILLLTLTASVAVAGGVGVSWGNYCWGEDGSRTNLTWACDSNTNDAIRMTCSFRLDADLPDFVGVGIYLEGMTEAAAVPDWWRLSNEVATDCRYGLGTVSADGTVLANGGTDGCVDPWQGRGSGGIGLYSSDGNRMSVQAAWTSPEAIPLEGGTEYFAAQFRVSAQRTVGSCTGCSIPAVWMLSRIDVCTPTTTLPLDHVFPGGNRCLTWQSSVLPCLNDVPDPARNSTWGLIKSLYR